MNTDQIKANLENLDKQLNERANQLLSADPVARELLGIKKGLELCLNEGGEPEPNGEVVREETLEAIAGG